MRILYVPALKYVRTNDDNSSFTRRGVPVKHAEQDNFQQNMPIEFIKLVGHGQIHRRKYRFK